jgi:hypothetical protein
MGRVDAEVGDPAGGICGVPAECGRWARQLERSGSRRGNWLASVEEPPEEAVATLREAMEDDEPLGREHAGWALEQLDQSLVGLRGRRRLWAGPICRRRADRHTGRIRR